MRSVPSVRQRSRILYPPVPFRPRVEVLEDRLPPGDILLGKLGGPAWLGVAARAAWPTAHPAVISPAPAFIATGHGSLPALVSGTASAAAPRPSAPAPLPARVTAPLQKAGDPLDLFGTADTWQELDGSRGVAAARHGFRPGGAGSPAPAEGAPAAPVAAPPTGAGGSGAVPSGAATAGPGSPPPAADFNGSTADLLTLPAGNRLGGSDGNGTDAPPPRARVHALFQLDATTGGPFPSDRFTVADHAQNTNRRVTLPYPDCSVYVSDCQDITVLNELDGFNLQPRLSVPFDGAIDVNSVSSQSMFLVSLGDTLDRHDRGGQVIGINQVVWDTFTDTLHVESDQSLDQHTRYALIVTNGIHDQNGHPVGASQEFRHFRRDLSHSHDPVLRFYGEELEDAVRAARHTGVRERDIVDASVFTTESATAVLEKIRDQIHAATPKPADFNLGPKGERTVFPFTDGTRMVWDQQTGADPPTFTRSTFTLDTLRIFPGAVGQLAFGRYTSPDYEIHPGEYIPQVGTRTGVPAVQGFNDVYFSVTLPAGPKPAKGWPVAIYGHSQGGDLFETRFMAASLAHQGIATISITMVGNGFGLLSTRTVNEPDGKSITFPAGGRGIDQNEDHVITPIEGMLAIAPRGIINTRDAERQTVADLMQLARVIEVGMDVDGDGVVDLDASRLYYFGFSLGGRYGMTFLATEPDVRAGVTTGSRSASAVYERLNPALRSGSELGLANQLARRVPPLINSPGITEVEGVPVPSGSYFNDNLPLRDGVPLHVRLEDGTTQEIRSPVVSTVPGAMAIQQYIENREWVYQSGDPVAYAPHLRKQPLAGVPPKSVILQISKGDYQAVNPGNTALIRAGDLADRTTYYRHDLAYAENPALPKNPHSFIASVGNPDWAAIALGAQDQMATFFASDGTEVIHPEPARFFETPIQGTLPEDLNFIP